MNREQVYSAIDSERTFQDAKWGTLENHGHEVGGWLTIMARYLREAQDAWASNRGDADALVEIRKLITVGVACCEQHGVEPRKNRYGGTI
jgi:hypothetical protein